MSVIEIYCERIRDLLEPGNDNLQVQQERLRGITVAHTTEVPVSSEAELVNVMHKGLANRAVASTAMNAGGCLAQYAVSSRHRSHRNFVLLVSMSSDHKPLQLTLTGGPRLSAAKQQKTRGHVAMQCLHLACHVFC